jgi:hypothetical protein
MGVTKSINKKYYKISYGRVVESVDKDTPEAVARVTKNNKTVYELIYKDIFGKLENVKYREDSEFGNSWQVSLKDNGELFVLQLPEDSKYCKEFLKRLPNMKVGQGYVFAPYEFVSKDGKKSGLIIKTLSDEKVESFYQKFTEKPDGKWDVENLHGYPTFTGDANKKSDWKKYGIDVTDFLKEKALEYIASGINDIEEIPLEAVPTDLEKDDLPF